MLKSAGSSGSASPLRSRIHVHRRAAGRVAHARRRRVAAGANSTEPRPSGARLRSARRIRVVRVARMVGYNEVASYQYMQQFMQLLQARGGIESVTLSQNALRPSVDTNSSTRVRIAGDSSERLAAAPGDGGVVVDSLFRNAPDPARPRPPVHRRLFLARQRSSRVASSSSTNGLRAISFDSIDYDSRPVRRVQGARDQQAVRSHRGRRQCSLLRA